MRRLLLLLFFAVLLGVAIAAFLHGRGISARRVPTSVETQVARAAWRYLVPRGVGMRQNPIELTPATLRAGLERFADQCAMCHAKDGSGDTAIGRGLHPRAPDLRAAGTQALSDGELFYAIEEGIPWTGMPAWSNGTAAGARDSWALVHVVRHLPKLTPADTKSLERRPPR